MARSGAGRLTRPPLTGTWALAPALAVLGLLVAAAAGYAVAQSLGALPLAGTTHIGVDAYGDLLGGEVVGDLWASAGFTLWVSAASTLVACGVALAVIAWLERPRRGRRRGVTALLHVNFALPHVVWAVALLAVLSQSGIVARIAAAAGAIDAPSDFPALVRDRYGIGIVLHYATKEAPFLTLVGLAMLRAQPRELGVIADTLGAHGLRRIRLVVMPTVAPGLMVASALVFAFVFGAYEAPVILGVSSPRALSVLGLDLFNAPDLALRPVAMALGVLMSVTVVAIVWGASVVAARRRS